MARNVEVNGVVTSVTPDTGSVVAWGTQKDVGTTITMYKSGGGGEAGKGTFVKYGDKVVAIIPQVKPGNYWFTDGVGDCTVAADYVSQTTKRY
ncbi:MAG: hypothetical protein ACJ8CB_01570 [Ktedonobacteraceae bacterium]